MPRASSGIVAGLTAAAIAAVCFLAFQASASAPDSVADVATPRSSGASGASGGTPARPSATPTPTRDPLAVPADSDTGLRVVYALRERRVWLVDAKEKALRTFTVMPSSVSPLPGAYAVSSRSGSVKGSDGVPIEHVVRFANVDGVSVGFSAAQDDSLESPDPTLRTGGVRMKRADGDVLWTFATVGVKIVVVP